MCRKVKHWEKSDLARQTNGRAASQVPRLVELLRKQENNIFSWLAKAAFFFNSVSATKGTRHDMPDKIRDASFQDTIFREHVCQQRCRARRLMLVSSSSRASDCSPSEIGVATWERGTATVLRSYVIGRLSCALSLLASLVGEHVLRPWCWRVLPRALMDDQTNVCSQSRHLVGLTQDMIVSVLPFRFGL